MIIKQIFNHSSLFTEFVFMILALEMDLKEKKHHCTTIMSTSLEEVQLQFNSIYFLLRIVQQEIFTKYDVTYSIYRKYAMVVMNVQTQDRRH